MKLSIFLPIAFLSCPAFGQLPAYPIPRLESPIEFDGKIGKGEWDSIDTLSLVSHWSTYSDKPNARTLFRVAYDDKFLYFSTVCYDNPDHMREPTFERDRWEMSMDQVAIILDTYNDNENGVIFVVTPTSSRIDVSLKNDGQGDSPTDESWNSYWEASTSKNEYGWEAEARIPFSSLRFQITGNNVTMGLIAYRYMARDRLLDIYPNIPPDWGFWSFIKSSKAQDVSFANVKNKRPWFTSPYVLGTAGHHHVDSDEDETTHPDKVNDNKITAGLDVQHALTDNMNLDLTFNTDFAQVEADDQVINLSRFDFFFPEKRRFFLERSSIMDFGFDKDNRLFYSRRIGIEDGKITPLWGGARVVGRVGNYDLGFMNMQSRASDGNASENFGVLRMRRRVSKNNSYIGGIFTSRTDWKGANNFAYGLDGIINLFGNDYLKVNIAGSYDSEDTLDYSHLLEDRKRIYVMWENRSQVGFNYSLSYSQVDKSYLPGIGFELRQDFKAVGDRLSYGWFTDKSKLIRFIRFDLLGTAYYSNSKNNLESFLLSPTYYMEGKKYDYIKIAFNRYFDNVPEAFSLSDDIEIEAAEYVNKDISIEYQTPAVKFLSAIFNATAGTFYGGDRITAGITPTYVISKYITLSGFYQYNHISFSDKPTYLAQVARLKVSTSFNVHLSINAFIQHNSLTDVSSVNFRLRYNWKDGNDLYVVYNETMNHEGNTDPAIPFSDYRAFTVKYIHTFHLGR
jgi:hypothetical protein